MSCVLLGWRDAGRRNRIYRRCFDELPRLRGAADGRGRRSRGGASRPPHHAKHQYTRHRRGRRAHLPPGDACPASGSGAPGEPLLKLLPHLLRGRRGRCDLQHPAQGTMPFQLLRARPARLKVRLHPFQTPTAQPAVDILIQPPPNQHTAHRYSPSSWANLLPYRRRKVLRARCRRTLTAATEQFITSAISSSDIS